jgi:(p)ppGpp synthase/HD superfamily hydrolase
MDEIFDLYAFLCHRGRHPECYNVLGCIQTFSERCWPFKDYMDPKPNMTSAYTPRSSAEGIPLRGADPH